eukprot:jgi/Chlat1/463/Chrsp103S01079
MAAMAMSRASALSSSSVALYGADEGLRPRQDGGWKTRGGRAAGGATDSALMARSAELESSASGQRGGVAGTRRATCMTASLVRPTKTGPQYLGLTPEKLEVIRTMDGFFSEEILPMLKPVEKSWQPADFLPDPASESFLDEVRDLQARAKDLTDEYFVTLIGDMITEEALPTYQTMLNTLDGTRDISGADPTPWAVWTRAWTAEENRHGDLLNKYLYLSGRVNMKAVETTIQYLIGSGMDPKTDNNPYLGFIYTSFQERATKISHGNTGFHAKKLGEKHLAQVCGIIAADEGRHEIAYTRIVDKLFELDPSTTMVCFEDMMKKQIVMPAHLMYDGESKTLFKDFSAVAQRLKVYTAEDYAEILEHLLKRWNVATREGLTSEAQAAQDYVMRLPARVRKIAERAEAKKAKADKEVRPFSWIYGREVEL